MQTAFTTMVAIVVTVSVSFALSAKEFAQNNTATPVFVGTPIVKISEAGIERFVEPIDQNLAPKLSLIISKISGKYYWATRENKELMRRVSGRFIAFVAEDGSGYVRITDPTAKSAASLMSPTEATFDYKEHLLLGLRSVTYFGKRH